MDHVLIGSAIAFLITFSAIPIIIRVAELKHLFDVPNSRKVHASPIPSLGGIGIFAGFILAALMALPAGSQELQYYIAAFLVIFFLGIKDDIIILSPLKKFLGQILAAGILIFKGGILIKGLHGFLGVEEMPYYFSVAFTWFTIIVITNSFNLIDGVDGLAGSLGMIASAAFGTYFLFAHQVFFAVMGFSLAGSLAAFLIFNISPARIFMGDTGSLLVGMVNSILAIKFIETATSADTVLHFASAPAIAFAILYIPLFDTLRIFSYRILTRRSPFSPDKNHIHHLLLERGWTHNTVTVVTVVFNVLIIAATLLSNQLSVTILIVGLLSIGFSFISLLIYSNRTHRRKLFPMSFKDQARKPVIETKIISLKTGSQEMETEEVAQ
ncbi:MAG: MraY family glycosyltransferase [Lacibacter sp.]